MNDDDGVQHQHRTPRYDMDRLALRSGPTLSLFTQNPSLLLNLTMEDSRSPIATQKRPGFA